MRKIHRLDLDFAKDIRTQRKITFKEQDSITLYISIYNDGVPVMLEGQIPRLFVKKSDGTVLYQREVLQVQNNVVAFDVHRQATTCPGLCYAEVEFIEPKGDGKDELITTRNFVYLVEPKVGDIENAIVSQDEAYFLKTVEDFINQSKKDLTEYKATALEIENQIDEANNRIEQLNKDLEEADLSLSEAKEQALEEINAVKDESIANIETTASNGLQEIETAKTDTINEINTLKENSIELFNVKHEEIIASGTQIKNDIEDLGNTVTTEITEGLESLENKKTEVVTKVDEKIDEAETKLNEIKIAQEEIDESIRLADITKNDLEALRQSAIDIIEELNNSSIEAEAISNLLNNLIADCDAIRNALEMENNEAISNLEELNPLNIEADLNIEELRALIQEARDIAIPALKAYIEEHKPAEDLTEVNAQLEELYNAVRELDIRFNNYYTKEEVDKKFSEIKGLEVKGFIGESLQFPPVEAKFANMVIPEDQISNYPEVKHTFTYKQYNSSNTYFKRVFFFCDLNNANDGKYLSFDGRYIQFHNITPDDYVMVQCDASASNPTPNPRPYALTVLDCLDLNNIVHGFDFNLYNPEGTAIVENDPSKSGIGDFNQATEDGFYTINTTTSGFSTLVNAPAFTPSKDVKGILKVIGGNQTLDITSEGVVFEREQNGLWNNTLDKAIKKESVGSITSDVKTITPAFFKSLPADARYFIKNKQRLLFRSRENTYVAMRFATTAEKCNITYNMGRNELYIQPKKEVMQIDTYDATTGLWKTEIGRLSSAYGEFTVLKDFFVVYENTMTIKYGGGTIYQEPTIAKFDGTPTINNFNNAIEVGTYTVDIKVDDTIENAPCEGAITGILKVSKAGKTICQELVKDTNNVYIRTLINDEWTQWKESGATVDLSDFYTKEETETLVDEKISAIDMSNYYNKTEIDEKLVKEIGAIKSGDPNFKEPVWDVLPENTFINIPANPDPATYKWEMKCSHYGYHMVFYFPIDPTGKFGIVQRTDGKLGFKLLDSSFKYKTYTSYYKEKNSSTKWSAMPSDNHFLNPEKRELEAIYSHNFDIVDGNNPNVIFRYGSQNDFDAEPTKDFNEATELEVYTVNATESGIIENSPMTGTFKGVLEVVKANGFIEQTLKDINSDTSYFRRFDKTSWSEWRPNTLIEDGEHIIEAPATLEEDEELDLLSITRGTIKDNDKYYARIAPTKRFTKVTGVTLASDLADLIIGFELNLNAVLINNSKDFMLFMKNNFKATDPGYSAYEGLNMLMGRKIKYTIIGY